ncbi:MAG: hypothetical protein HQL58_11110 [Magnetococcales bacterium]|nr:hypothetical protein [Magnetococcales bacterium]
MAWLWLISVGVTDIQFPVWTLDDAGILTGPRRFEIERGGIRDVHKGLLALLQNQQISFPPELPNAIPREERKGLKLDFLQSGTDFVATIHHDRYQISNHATKEIPNERETKMPLYCPKVRPLLDLARGLFGEEPVRVVVLNTHRDEQSFNGPNEPIASGPLVAKFIAEQLGLNYLDHQGGIPAALEAATSTWVDILCGNEVMEQTDTQQKIIQRLTAIIRANLLEQSIKYKIAITTTGGMPPLKSIIERVPAICLGQEAVVLLEQPEHGPVSSKGLNYSDRADEREILRFHCAEALRHGDYASAYGLANRYSQVLPWAKMVRNRLGPLLDLPSSGNFLSVQGRNLHSHERYACQVDVRLCMGDIAGAVMKLGIFLESVIWYLIKRSSQLQQLGLRIKQEYGPLDGPWPGDDIFNKLLDKNSDGDGRHRIKNLWPMENQYYYSWSEWLVDSSALQSIDRHIADRLLTMCRRYNKKDSQNSHSMREYRNLLLHSSVVTNLDEIRKRLERYKLIAGVGEPLGRNFLSLDNVQPLLVGFGVPKLAVDINRDMANLLDTVIEW